MGLYCADSHPWLIFSTDKMGSSSVLNHACRLTGPLKMQLVSWLFGLVPLYAAGLDSESCTDSTEMLFLHIPYNFGYTVASSWERKIAAVSVFLPFRSFLGSCVLKSELESHSLTIFAMISYTGHFGVRVAMICHLPLDDDTNQHQCIGSRTWSNWRVVLLLQLGWCLHVFTFSLYGHV